ncbi:hypothetical protein P692DRAFT_20824394 [Suillus brevipes Sb2]|nr:hypothetical protein P692DRAFT_20824394 [Suillus brevipes Sb2]
MVCHIEIQFSYKVILLSYTWVTAQSRPSSLQAAFCVAFLRFLGLPLLAWDFGFSRFRGCGACWLLEIRSSFVLAATFSLSLKSGPR